MIFVDFQSNFDILSAEYRRSCGDYNRLGYNDPEDGYIIDLNRNGEITKTRCNFVNNKAEDNFLYAKTVIIHNLPQVFVSLCMFIEVRSNIKNECVIDCEKS